MTSHIPYKVGYVPELGFAFAMLYLDILTRLF